MYNCTILDPDCSADNLYSDQVCLLKVHAFLQLQFVLLRVI